MMRVLLALSLTSFGACGFPRPPDVPGTDGAVDTDALSPPCFGSFQRVCLANAPTAPWVHETQNTIDTASSTLCAETTDGADNYCVIAATTISFEVALRATGARPLVLLASDSILVSKVIIDVGSHRGAASEIGAGADPLECVSGLLPGDGGGNGAGGAGGSFVTLGGMGGRGGSAGTSGLPGAMVSAVPTLRGGCPGQEGQANNEGVSGHGGGAVLLIAGNKIQVVQGEINASGEGGRGGDGGGAGGGGGGAGGMIVLDSPTIELDGTFLATGGGGGEGGGSQPGAAGVDGLDPSTTDPAGGGAGNTPQGGDGGKGATTPGVPAGSGIAGIVVASSPGGGGGGGGGGIGLIKVPVTATAGVNIHIAPPATP